MRVVLSSAFVGASLLGCGGGSSGPPPAQTAEQPPQPPQPPAPSTLPPLSATVVPLDDNHMVGVRHWDDGATSSGGQGQPVGALECLELLPQSFHVHAHLSIFLNGEALAIPRHIGIVQTSSSECLYPTHTHDRTGLVHLEWEVPTTFTLGQFFSVWGQPLERNDVAGLMGMPVVVYVTDDDGIVHEHTGDLAAVELRSHREITIQIGTPITEIPNFTWAGD